MDRKLAALLLREVFLPGKYPYHINISSDDYSDNDIEKCMLDMEKEGLLHFWEQKVYLGDSTSTYHCTDFHLPISFPQNHHHKTILLSENRPQKNPYFYCIL